SNAFKDITGLKLSESGELPLELIVQVYNINHGHNTEILEKSKNLNEYSILMRKINEYSENLPLEEAVTSAVKYCVEYGILKEFLEEHGSEVINMLFEDISIEEIAAIRYAEGHEEGLEKGSENEKNIIAKNLLSKGSTPVFVSEVTGLSLEEVNKLY
ncbi:MAG: hypothetical protein FWB86_14795, partial [Treponema sp.]|nr:hypothetical protein [Treponema sp.]